jgi:hypothetical protein
MSTHELVIDGVDLERDDVMELWLAAKKLGVPVLADILHSKITQHLLPDGIFDVEKLGNLERIMAQLDKEEFLDGIKFLEELQETVTIKTLAWMNEHNVGDIIKAIPHALLEPFTKRIALEWM